ncbi:MAG: GNAT family N-acetyltransferase [Methylotenera sp.]
MVLVNEKQYLTDFIQLNEAWITHYFKLEDADRALAGNPAKIIEDGGYIFSLIEDGQVVGVCALFKDDDADFQLARMAVKNEHQGKGYGDALLIAAIAKLREIKASRVYLLSNTILIPAINLYKKYGFTVFSMGQHPVYARCDIVMEKIL